MIFNFSVLRFLIGEYELNSGTFLYEWNYDATHQISVISNIYIDLGNYLSGRKSDVEFFVDFLFFFFSGIWWWMY
jgi:hypothetical protein